AMMKPMCWTFGMNDSWNEKSCPSHFSATAGALGLPPGEALAPPAGDGDEPPPHAARTRAAAGNTAASLRFTVMVLLSRPPGTVPGPAALPLVMSPPQPPRRDAASHGTTIRSARST